MIELISVSKPCKKNQQQQPRGCERIFVNFVLDTCSEYYIIILEDEETRGYTRNICIFLYLFYVLFSGKNREKAEAVRRLCILK